MILAAVGVGIAVVLLAFLSIYQQAAAKRKKQATVETVRATTADAKDVPPGKTPFFIACYLGNNARFFRVYRTPGELLFLYAGPYYAMIDAETPRGSDSRHWTLRSMRMLGIALASGGVAALIAIAVISLAVVRNPYENPVGAVHVLLGVLGIVALLAIVVTVATPTVVWWMTKRAAELDAMSLNQLREHAAVQEKSFRAARENVTELKISPLEPPQGFGALAEIRVALSFKHAPTGRWKIETLTTQDSRDAVGAALALWGRERVQVDERLLERLKSFDQWSAEHPMSAADATHPMSAEETILAGSAGIPLPSLMEAPPPAEQVVERHRPKSLPPKTVGGTYSVNGFGTMVCEARGLVEWDSNMEDSDSILAFCLLGIPIVPYAAVHTSNWEYEEEAGSGMRYLVHPIRWSWSLVGAALIRRLWVWIMIAGAIPVFASVIAGSTAANFANQPAWLQQGYNLLLVGVGGALVAALAFGIRHVVLKADRRHQNIRLLLGRHFFGSSDPRYWTHDTLKLVRPPQQAFGTPTFAAAVPALQAAGELQAAMFAGRLSTALEDASTGERLTDAILSDPEAAERIARLRRQRLSCDVEETPSASQWHPAELFA
ncbi:MAG TPA: hypothetical protein VGN57_17815 [Pirellulaceae bacterium]|jgi:hypothetical protein|nr:hypothetical protein [Pirellulaceae bacterium]